MLLFVGLVDELLSGGPVLSAPDLASELDLAAAGLAGALFTVPMLVGTALEAVILAASDRFDRRWAVAAGLVGVAAGQVGILLAPDVWALAAAVSLWMTAAGVATSAAEVALVAASDDADRTMARWGMLGAVGDLAAPVVFAAVAAAGLGWRAALLFGAAVALANAVAVVLAGPMGGDADADDDEEPLRDAIRGAVGNAELVGWLVAATACTLLDEILVAFGGMWLRDGGAGPVGQGLQMALFAIGAVGGLAVAERRVETTGARRVLLACAAVCAVAYVGWLAAPSAGLQVVAMLVLGAATAPMWALATARAYASSKRPGLVAALGNLGVPFEVAAPLLIGAVADRYGLLAAMLLLLVQPLVVAVVAARVGRR